MIVMLMHVHKKNTWNYHKTYDTRIFSWNDKKMISLGEFVVSYALFKPSNMGLKAKCLFGIFQKTVAQGYPTLLSVAS